MNPSDFLNQLPSVNELLEHPQVQSVTDRLNKSVVATRVRGYLDQLAEEAKRRAADAEATVGEVLPDSMRDLVDRVSRYLTKGDRWRVGAAINATGRLRGGPWSSTPMADAAVERIVLTASDFTANSAASDDANSLHHEDAAAALCRATGAPAAAVFNSRTSALWLALASLPPGGGVVIARTDLVTLDGGCRVIDLIERVGLRVQEVGAVDGASLDDFAAAVNENTACILRVAVDDAWPAPTHNLATNELADLVHRNGALLIEDTASAPLLEIHGNAPQLSSVADGLASAPMEATRRAGADLVIGRGDGLLCGPACGVVLGTTSAIRPLYEAPLASAFAVEPHVGAALAATVELLSDTERFWFNVPIWSLLTTPLENLETRAERIAVQLSAPESIEAAEVVKQSAREATSSGLPIRLPTALLSVKPASRDAAELADVLRGGEPAVVATTDEGRLLIDLRTVFPRQDGELVDAITRGKQPSPAG